MPSPLTVSHYEQTSVEFAHASRPLRRLSAVTAGWPFVGRDDELARIAEAGERGCCGVVITAAAGAGKTRLGREALAAAERDGAMTQWVQATKCARMIPLGAFAGLLADGARADEPLAVLRESARVLHDRARGRAIVLGVDDAQLLDAVSATLVLHLATSADVFVVVTVRAGEQLPDAIASLWKDAGAYRLPLVRLSDEAVRAAGRDGARWSVGGDGDSLGGGSEPGQPALCARARARRRRHGSAEALARSMAALGTDLGGRDADGARRAASVRAHGRPTGADRAARAG